MNTIVGIYNSYAKNVFVIKDKCLYIMQVVLQEKCYKSQNHSRKNIK